MKVTRSHLNDAVDQNIITADQSVALMAFLRSRPGTGARFDLTHVLYYLGGLVAIGAMTLFMNLGWEQFGGWGIFYICLCYAAIGLYISMWFNAQALAVPAGICATFVVALVPLGIYGLQLALGLWPDDTPYNEYHYYIKWHWIYLELGTLMVTLLMTWLMRYPFMLMPVAVTLWYMSMDVVVMLTGGQADWEFRAFFSMLFGVVMLLIAFWTDLRSRHSGDYAFWLYLFGVLTFWGGLTFQNSDSELTKFIYFCINLLLIGCGALLVRRVFVVFGAMGCAVYLSHLASTVFADSWVFPVALTVIGFSIIFLGLVWQRNEERITVKLHGHLPQQLRELLQARFTD